VAQPRIQVPEKFQESLTHLAAIGDDEFSGFNVRLSTLAPTIGVKELIAAASESSLGANGQGVVLAALSLSAQMRRTSDGPEDLARNAAQSMGLLEDKTETLANRLGKLLSLDHIGALGRAYDLMAEHERIYRTARVITDVRPLFPNEPDVPPSRGVVVETLKLEYTEAGAQKSLFLALDHSDLTQLKECVDRAIKKSELVTKTLSDTGMVLFDSEEATWQ